MDLKIAQLRNFVDVAETRSFQAAAARAFRSQPAISMALKTLEQQLHALLLDSGKPVMLTPFGEQFLPIARQLLAHHDRVVLDASTMARGGQGCVSIAAVASVATYWLPTIIRTFAARCPDVLVSAVDDTSRKVQELVENGQIEIGIGSIVLHPSEVMFEPLVTDHFGLVCRREHPLGNSDDPIAWQQLQGLDIIGNSTHAMLEGHDVYSFVRAPRIVLTTLTSLVANVRGGVGVTVLPKLGVPADADLSFRLLVEPQVPRTLGILTRKGRALSPQGSAFCQVIRESLRHLGGA